MTSYYAQFLALHKEAQATLAAGLVELGSAIAGDILRLALPRAQSAQEAPTATIDGALEPTILEAARARVQLFFMGESGIPVLEQGSAARPNSPYVTLLWPYLNRAAMIAKDRQRALIQTQFANHPDVWARYEPFYDKGTAVIVQEIDRTFDARLMEIAFEELTVMETAPPERPTATYDPIHRWVKPDGYRLSDRIWIIDDETRRRLDLYLSTRIREGVSSTALAQGVVQFLTPGQYLPETNKPYGRNLSYNAMRLARTEISAAYNQADAAAARMNPLIVSYNANRSRYGKPCLICDPITEDSPYDILDETGVPPFHPHCLCNMTFNYQEEIADTIERVRAELRDKHPELFDANGLMKLADRIRVNTSKWIPGQLAGPEPQLVRTTLEAAATRPTQVLLEKTFWGVFEGDLYYDRANLTIVEKAKAGTGTLPRHKFSVDSGYYSYSEGLKTTFEMPEGNRFVMRMTTDGLNVAPRSQMGPMLADAQIRATEIWSQPVTHMNENMFARVVMEQLEFLAREAGIDAFVVGEGELHIIAWEKIRFAEAYSQLDFARFARGDIVFKPLSEAMSAAAERFDDLHVAIETNTKAYNDLSRKYDQLYQDYHNQLRMVEALEESYERSKLINPLSEETKLLKQRMDNADKRLTEIGILREDIQLELRTVNMRYNMSSLFAGETSFDITPDYMTGYKTGTAKKKWDDAFDWVSNTVNGEVYDSALKVEVNRLADYERAFARNGNIYLAPTDTIATAIHEIGHAIEDSDPYTHQRLVEFLHSRTNAANVSPLGGSYGADEVADADNFWNPYVGKIYGTWQNPVSTEILSMGLERLYYDPFGFYQDDREFFDFIVGLISGWI